ncbi:MAG TPA: tetratricopeptide repeat protein [Xanthobacteraceae bacterium]
MNRQQRRAARRSGAQALFNAQPPTASDGAVAGLFNAALVHHQIGAIAEAERHYRRVLDLAPFHADSLHNLGVIALQRRDPAAAVELIGKAIAVNDRIADYHYNVALAWRALGLNDKVTEHLERAVALRSDHTLAHLNLGNIRREQGRAANAIACYERAIASGPNLTAARFNLANFHAEQGRWDVAISRYNEVLALEPNHAAARSGLGGAYLAKGDLKSAILAATRALDLAETEQNKAFFAQCASLAQFTEDNSGRLRPLMLRAIAEGWDRPRTLINACISLIKLDRAVSDAIARVSAAWPTRLPAATLFGASGLNALAQDALLCRALESAPLTDIDLERFLTSVRHALLTTNAVDTDEHALGFYVALAQQCYINDYVYSLADGEADAAKRLRIALEATLEAGKECPPLWPVVVGAYFPLHTLAKAEVLLERTFPQSVCALLVQQIEEPMEEQRIAATIPVLTSIDSDVSRSVRQQYEENPYPRWVKAGPPGPPIVLNDRQPEQAYDVLIAGCGTGLSAVEFARQTPHARVLAVDLSLASISYGSRMAKSLNLTNLEFAHADIMGLGGLSRQFDYIDVSGVLHHLADPWAGWRVLLSLLRPGGTMQLGLYSEAARQNVIAARALITMRGYRPVADDIRRCREDIMAAADPLLQSLTNSGDFFATNECRDLLFHVQERHITLREVKSFLAANDVQFSGFILDALTLHRFAARFPEPAAMTDLDSWDAFETEAPQTFAKMYQFWVRKP